MNNCCALCYIYLQMSGNYCIFADNMTEEQMGYYNENNELTERLNKIERQIKNLDTRIQKLENVSNETNDNIYMI